MALTLRICNMEHNFRWTSQWRDITASYCYRWFAWQCRNNIISSICFFIFAIQTFHKFSLLDLHFVRRSRDFDELHVRVQRILGFLSQLPTNQSGQKWSHGTWLKQVFLLDQPETLLIQVLPMLVQVRKLGLSWIRSIKRRIWECWVGKKSSNCRTLLLQRNASEKDNGPEQGIWRLLIN